MSLQLLALLLALSVRQFSAQLENSIIGLLLELETLLGTLRFLAPHPNRISLGAVLCPLVGKLSFKLRPVLFHLGQALRPLDSGGIVQRGLGQCLAVLILADRALTQGQVELGLLFGKRAGCLGSRVVLAVQAGEGVDCFWNAFPCSCLSFSRGSGGTFCGLLRCYFCILCLGVFEQKLFLLWQKLPDFTCLDGIANFRRLSVIALESCLLLQVGQKLVVLSVDCSCWLFALRLLRASTGCCVLHTGNNRPDSAGLPLKLSNFRINLCTVIELKLEKYAVLLVPLLEP
ncbi:hypothetical protein D3C77_450150 [compost metagenome]